MGKGRKSLYQKLKDRDDFEITKERILYNNKPLVYIRDTYKCSHPAAKRLLEELSLGCEVVRISKKEISEEDWVTRFLDMARKKCSTLLGLISIFDNLEDLGIEKLRDIFYRLSSKQSLTKSRAFLILAIKYMMQHKYYSKDIPTDTVLKREKLYIGECLK